MPYRSFIIGILSVICVKSQAQNTLLDSLEIDSPNMTVSSFKALQIVNLQSTKMVNQGDFYFVVSHRFGSLNEGINTFFGLDNANTKIGFIYGATKWLSLGISRHTLNKVYEGTLKYRVLEQNEKSPIALVGYHSLQINTQLDTDVYPGLDFQNRLSYVSQVLLSRAFSRQLSLELIGSYLYKNIYNPEIENQSQFSIGTGGRLRLSKRISLNAEYMYSHQPGFYKNPLSLGVDIETGGHVFQLLFTNSQGMTESAYLSSATGNWADGDIYFGFNLYRVF